MKGKSTFTKQDVAELRRLITEKRTADRDRQKALRGKMRSIGFYVTDFVTDQHGFTVSNFDDLIARGTIVVKANGETRLPSRSAAERKGVRREPAGYSTEERDQARARRERAARQYKPTKVDLLLVAEAPPSALDRYFYFPDVREQDSLFRYVVALSSATSQPATAKPSCSRNYETAASSSSISKKSLGTERR